ncbi:MAG: preprotein translocase subunit YajC [Saccharofermentanales bacterium]|jgi:preprotein translocase subunit YajC|nr:preprotein translocase subunit YajC [Clostridiaceae bacterium]
MMFSTFLMAAKQATEETAQKGGILQSLGMFLPFILIIVVMYFFTIRPQKKRERELKAKLDRMKPGDKVMSIGGIVGRVANISGDEVTIYSGVASTMLTFKKSAISTVISDDEGADSDKDSKKSKKESKKELKEADAKDSESSSEKDAD